jgi:hypothetical protein
MSTLRCDIASSPKHSNVPYVVLKCSDYTADFYPCIPAVYGQQGI